MHLKERLAQLRRERGYTLRELRDRIEERAGERMSVSYLSELERLDTTPSIEVLTRVARGYDLSLQALLSPVAFHNEAAPRYPRSLMEFVQDRNLDPSWLDTLGSIEYRGQRPDTATEWEAIYGVLNALIEPKTRKAGSD